MNSLLSVLFCFLVLVQLGTEITAQTECPGLDDCDDDKPVCARSGNQCGKFFSDCERIRYNCEKRARLFKVRYTMCTQLEKNNDITECPPISTFIRKDKYLRT